MRELREQVRELQAAVAAMRSDWQHARAETAELRRELDEVRAGTAPRNPVFRDAVVTSETPNSKVAGSFQDSSQSVLQNGAPQDEKHDQKQNQEEIRKKASTRPVWRRNTNC